MVIRDLFSLRNYGLENYLSLKDSMIWLGLWNSFLISSLGSSLATVISFLGAYSLASPLFREKGGNFKKVIALLIFASLLFPSETKVLINFLIMKFLGLVNTYSGVFLPSAANLFTFLLFYQAILTYPKELEEAALLEGMSPLGIALNVVMPSLRGVVTTAFIFNFVALWNDFLWPLVVIPTAENKMPLQVMIAELLASLKTNFGHVLAATILASLPVILLLILMKDKLMSFELK